MLEPIFDIQLNLAKSHGSYLYDDKRNCPFLDYFGLYSSLAVGYNHPVFDQEFFEQLKVLGPVKMANNVMHTQIFERFLKEFSSICFSSHIHLANSGSAAVEDAIKVALKGRDFQKVPLFALKNSFHGIGSFGMATDLFSATEKRLQGMPRMGFQHFFEQDLLKQLRETRDGIVLIESIQSTAGDIHFPLSFFQELKKICLEFNHCLIFDEVQTGMGSTGHYWYYEKLGVIPDILVFGKKAQVSGLVIGENFKEVYEDPAMKIHQTFDGTLIDCLRFLYVKKAIEENNLLQNVREKGEEIKAFLQKRFSNVRGEGFLLSYDFSDSKERDEHVQSCFSKHLLINPTSEKSVRLRPNLALSDSELEAFIKTF